MTNFTLFWLTDSFAGSAGSTAIQAPNGIFTADAPADTSTEWYNDCALSRPIVLVREAWTMNDKSARVAAVLHEAGETHHVVYRRPRSRLGVVVCAMVARPL
jgi:hypothetical protein